MKHVENSPVRRFSHALAGVVFFASLMGALAIGLSLPAMAQEKLTGEQRQTLAQCLIGCKKGDANCQNACTGKVASPAYSAAAGACVRACADSLVAPGRKDESLAEDLQICVQACQ